MDDAPLALVLVRNARDIAAVWCTYPDDGRRPRSAPPPYCNRRAWIRWARREGLRPPSGYRWRDATHTFHRVSSDPGHYLMRLRWAAP